MWRPLLRLPATAPQGFELKRRGELKLIKVFQVGAVQCWGQALGGQAMGGQGDRRAGGDGSRQQSMW